MANRGVPLLFINSRVCSGLQQCKRGQAQITLSPRGSSLDFTGSWTVIHQKVLTALFVKNTHKSRYVSFPAWLVESHSHRQVAPVSTPPTPTTTTLHGIHTNFGTFENGIFKKSIITYIPII